MLFNEFKNSTVEIKFLDKFKATEQNFVKDFKPGGVLACLNSHPSSLPARETFREKPLGLRAKKDGCFSRLGGTGI